MNLLGPQKRKIYLYISDIASYIGQNYFDYVTPFERLWKKCDSQSYQELLSDMRNDINKEELDIIVLNNEKLSLDNELEEKKITKRQYSLKLKKLELEKTKKEEKINTIQERIDEIDLTQKQQLEKIVGEKTINNMESKDICTNDKKSQMNNALESLNLKEEKLMTLKKTAESFINKTHGTLKEESAIEMFENKYNVKLDTSQQFNKRHLKSISQNSSYDWYICGKVDGLYIDTNPPYNSYIVEVKNRTKSFFSTLRDYEKTQIQLYLFMLEMDNAKLVEKLNNKIKITEVPKDDIYIEDILDFLNLFIYNFESKFLQNDNLKSDYTIKTTHEKKTILKKLFFNDINILNNQKITERMNKDNLSDDENDCMIEDL
jgi:hypothetical protein